MRDTLSPEQQEVIEQIENLNVETIHLQFTDLLGGVKSVSIPVSRLEKAFTEGIYFDGSSIEGFVRIQESDMRLTPDPSTFTVLPWIHDSATVGRMICDVVDTTTNKPFEGDPRRILRRAVARAEDHGYTVNMGPEPEFFLFERDDQGRPTTNPTDTGGYFDFAPKESTTRIRQEIGEVLAEMGFDVETNQHEVAAGQHEIVFQYADALKTADNIATFKTVVSSIASRHDLHATFMPKPITGINGSGMHTHISLFSDGTNQFHDDDGEFGLSETANQFIAGILDHAPALTAVANPTINSYKRLVPGYEAPVYVAWSYTNRSALIRKPASRSPESSRIELRSPDPSSNPYLALAAIITAGIDGIERGLEAPDPVRENIYEFDADKRAEYGIATLPGSLKEALSALEDDETIKNALGEHTFEKFWEAKQTEIENYRMNVSDWERDQYLDSA